MVRMSSDRLLRGQKLARESAVLTAPRRLHNTKLDDFDMVKTIGTGETGMKTGIKFGISWFEMIKH